MPLKFTSKEKRDDKEDLRIEAQRELEATAEMLKRRGGVYDVFGMFNGNQIIDVASVKYRAVPVERLENGALVNGTDLPNGWLAGTAIYLGSINSDQTPRS